MPKGAYDVSGLAADRWCVCVAPVRHRHTSVLGASVCYQIVHWSLQKMMVWISRQCESRPAIGCCCGWEGRICAFRNWLKRCALCAPLALYIYGIIRHHCTLIAFASEGYIVPEQLSILFFIFSLYYPSHAVWVCLPSGIGSSQLEPDVAYPAHTPVEMRVCLPVYSMCYHL